MTEQMPLLTIVKIEKNQHLGLRGVVFFLRLRSNIDISNSASPTHPRMESVSSRNIRPKRVGIMSEKVASMETMAILPRVRAIKSANNDAATIAVATDPNATTKRITPPQVHPPTLAKALHAKIAREVTVAAETEVAEVVTATMVAANPKARQIRVTKAASNPRR